MELNQDQQQALKFLINWWYGKDRFAVLEGEAGTGKGLPLDEPILTPSGWSTMGDLKVGSKVYTITGEPTEVTDIYELGMVNMYKITFSDGSFSRCCEDHLWQIQTIKQRTSLSSNCKILTTKDLLKDYKKSTNRITKGGGFSYKYSIPLVQPIRFKNFKELPLDAYTLGYILGNGSSTEKQLVISLHIDDLQNILDLLPVELVLSYKHKETNTGIINIANLGRQSYNKLGLLRIKSTDKFIPEDYLYGSLQDRKALLAGLLDSDGTCRNNKASYSTSSKQLALGVIELIRGLGGKATLYTANRSGKVNIEYTVNFRLPFNPFYLKRKAKNYKVIPFDSSKTIKNIESIGQLEGRCIRVADESHLYITRDYTVTHNTFLVNHLVSSLRNCDAVFTAPTNEACRQLELTLPEDSLIRTTYSALGFNMSTKGELKELKQGRASSILNDVNLMIVDECSMIGETLLTAIKETGLKVLFLGDNLQLPEVNVELNREDKCKSIVFEQNFPTFTLLKNQRTQGELYNFIKSLRKTIYVTPRLFKNTYSANEIKLLTYIRSKEGKDELLNETAKIICYSNKAVDSYNQEVRASIFGKHCAEVVPRDKLILTEPTVFVGNLNKVSKLAILKMKDKAFTLPTNSKVEVKHVKHANVLGIDCHELEVEYKDMKVPLYVPIVPEQLEKLSKNLKMECFTLSSQKAKENAWKNYHYIMSLFTKCKYSYALTTHRSQGMTIDKVFVLWKNMQFCPNIYLRYKLLYVAASRAKEELTIIG